MALSLSLTLQEWISQNITTGSPRPPPTGVSACTAGLYAAVVGRLRLHRPAASTAADWCFRLHGWPLCRRCWASTSSPTGRLVRRRLVLPPARLAYYAAVVGRLRLHRPACLRRRRLVFPPARLAFMPPLLGVYVFTDRLAFAAADWCFRLHGWPLCCRCWASTSSPTGLPSPPPTGVSACTAGLYAAVVGRLRLHRLACLRRCRLVFPPARLAFMPPLLGVYVFTDRPPRPPPTGVSACTAGLLCRRCWASTSSPTGRLVSRRLVFPPARLAYYAAVVGRLRLHRPAASSAADWCFRLHGWPLCRRCWASTSSPTGRLVRRRLVLPPARLAYYAAVVGRLRLHRPACLRCRRLVFPPARLAYYAAVVGRLRLHRPAASSAADWCFRLHGWPIMRPLLGVYVFTDRLAFAAADWCFRLHGWPIMPPLLGVYVFTDRLAFAAADWCFRLHGWPIMPPLLGVYVFTDRPPRPPPTGVSACTAGLLCRRCWASTSSPTGRLVSRRLVFPPARLAIMPPLLGVYVFTDRPPRPPPTGASACTAGLLCCRCWASTSSPTGLPSPPPTGVSACTAGLLCRRCWASTSSPTGRLVRRRLVFPPARLAYYAAVVGRLRLHRPAASSAADWCFRLHGWPIMPPLLGVYVFTDRPPRQPPTGVSACTAGLYAAVVGRLRLHRPAAASAADWCHCLHGWPVITPTDATFFTAGYIAVTTNRHQYLQHKLPTFAMAADWFLHFHGCMILPVLIGLIFFTAGRLVYC
uniref:cysteine dioxygenase n=1 Tax=Oryza sativa subsp. japonica TaxID=39947 RepID=Q656M6_ORYSJ|nr:HGWP repeat containing protein-like [Oryza sativa Japonica Group]